MQIIADKSFLRQQILQWRLEGKVIAFIPTRGNIHQGHLALVREAAEQADIVVVSIFNHALQEKREELDSARILEQDIAALREHGATLAYTPSADEIQPINVDSQLYVEVPLLSTNLFKTTSSHPKAQQIFATSICRLLNIVQPDVIYFGENNIQRLNIVRKLINDFAFAVKVVSVATVREIDGLVASRHNQALTVDERQRAPVLAKTLRWASRQIRHGRRDFNELLLDCKDQLRAAGLEPDEIFIRDAETLQLTHEKTEKLLIGASVKLSAANLIDSLVVDIAPSTGKYEEEV